MQQTNDQMSRKQSIIHLTRVTVRTLGIPWGEAKRRVIRVADMAWLRDFGTPDTREYQVAVDVIMQIPSNQIVTPETFEKYAEEIMIKAADKDEKPPLPLTMEKILKEEWVVFVAPDGYPQIPTLATDFASCVAYAQMMAEKGIGKHPAQMFEEGFVILPVKLTVIQNGDEQKAFETSKPTPQ
jgi:hypothetical protein